ncbi:hypothetical protein [Methyloversatilis sp. XJ19-49]|uniref:hypothetical protein n=1 Tax=Methyloversatilis sp. XJ19-49 TaxID=2963429 RepID=UPI00211C7AB8|nr:hypothetical protein [Methyloversatilis sp. XJ19-49]MCQ9377570.1 hypothetical protein [Methyloversatilis sp. XJ19-49]
MLGIAALNPSYASCTLLFGLMLGIAALTPTYGLDPQAVLTDVAKPSSFGVISTMNISLPDTLKSFVDEQVSQSGPIRMGGR